MGYKRINLLNMDREDLFKLAKDMYGEDEHDISTNTMIARIITYEDWHCQHIHFDKDSVTFAMEASARVQWMLVHPIYVHGNAVHMSLL